MIKYTRTTADKLGTVPLIDGQVITVLDGNNYIQYYDFYDSDSDTVIRRTAKSSGGGGHTILDGNGNALTQRDNLQFSGGLWARDVSILNGSITRSLVTDGVWTDPVTALTGDTSVTITNTALHTSSVITPHSQTSSGALVSYDSIVVTEGQAVITFSDTLTENVDVQLNIKNNVITQPLPDISWATASYSIINTMLDAHYAGIINIADYWNVGDERIVHLDAMEAENGVNESHIAQDVSMVLLNAGGKILADGETECAFIVGMKDVLNNGVEYGERGRINSTATNIGGWKESLRRAWCNDTFYNSIESNFKSLLKQFINQTSIGNQQNQIENTIDWTALPSEIEILGNIEYSFAGEGSQFEYYEETANRIKKYRDPSNSAAKWWLRSPYKSNTKWFCCINDSGSKAVDEAQIANSIAPFCVI